MLGSTAFESTINGGSVSRGATATLTMSRSATTTRSFFRATRKHAPVHPGEILLTEFLEPLGISQYRLTKDISVSARRINEIVHGIRAITADTALRLSRYFGTSERFWLNLQTRYDLEVSKDALGSRLAKEVVTLKRAS